MRNKKIYVKKTGKSSDKLTSGRESVRLNNIRYKTKSSLTEDKNSSSNGPTFWFERNNWSPNINKCIYTINYNRKYLYKFLAEPPKLISTG